MARVVWQMGVTTNRYIAGPGGEGGPDHACAGACIGTGGIDLFQQTGKEWRG